MKISFLYLKSFDKTGGIEKFNRVFMYALQNLCIKNKIDFLGISVYDKNLLQEYIAPHRHKTFLGNKLKFIFYSIWDARKRDIIILGHIHLSIVGLIIKFLFPQKKVLLIVHGIEVWQKLPFLQTLFIRKTDKILSVSRFTKHKIIEHTPIDDSKFCWFPNTFDPYIKWPNHFVKNTSLLQKYGIDENSKILLTVSRLEFYEKYKGYDSVIRTLPALLAKFPNLVYVLIGKADEFEQKRISNLITELKVEKNVKLLGFVPDDALVNHYTMADVFVMPSQKEGFGIVFIEAVLCGLQVIAGNKDGSKEALLQGEVGILIDPDQIDELQNAIINCLENPLSTEQKIHRAGLINQHFNIEQFESRLKSILEIA